MVLRKIKDIFNRWTQWREKGRGKVVEAYRVENYERQFVEDQYEQVEFPILIEDSKGVYHLFHTSQEIIRDPDLVWQFGKFQLNMKLIDSQGCIFAWIYSDQLETYYPGSQEGVMKIEEVRNMLEAYLDDIPGRPFFGEEKSVKEIFLKLDGYV